MGKPRGLRTARKHVKNRRENVWADLDYNDLDYNEYDCNDFRMFHCC